MPSLRKIFADVLRRKSIQPWVIDSFHQVWYDSSDTWKKNTFLGYPTLQLPSDMWCYQELIFAAKPNFILQTGVKDGGSIVYFATLLDLIEAPPDALVVGVDLVLTDAAKAIKHPRVRLLEGSSVDSSILTEVRRLCAGQQGFVSLDSDHSRDHVLRELEEYWPFVAVGAHLVVEDTNINGHPVLQEFGPGPHEAVEAFLSRKVPFVVDQSPYQRQLITQHTWLRRVDVAR